jgi:uncharacterized coiled-coil DUF342 family protein
MDLELLGELEDKVDVTVSTVRELRVENDALKEDAQELGTKLEQLTMDLEKMSADRKAAMKLEKRCQELERKLQGVRVRISKMIERMKTLEE